jgi:hypothetical protein
MGTIRLHYYHVSYNTIDVRSGLRDVKSGYYVLRKTEFYNIVVNVIRRKLTETITLRRILTKLCGRPTICNIIFLN